MPSHLLVLLLDGASRDELEAVLAAHSDERPTVFVVAPRHVGALDWLATDERRADDAASVRALEAEWLLAGEAELGGSSGDADPLLAVRDALVHFPADELVVVGGGAIDPALLASLRGFGLPLSLYGLVAATRSWRGRLRALGAGLTSGRSAATPFVAMVAANLGLLALLVLGSLLVAIIVWLVTKA